MSQSDYTEPWLIRTQVIIAAVTFIGTFLLSILDKPAAPFAAVGIGGLLLFRFGDIASLTLEGFGAKAAVTKAERAARGADRATHEAEQAIETLKAIGTNLSVMALIQVSTRDMPFSDFLNTTVALRSVVISNLERLGNTPDEIEKATSFVTAALIRRMFSEALDTMPIEHSAAIHDQIFALCDLLPEKIDMAQARVLFSEQGFTDEAKDWLNKIELFQKTGEVWNKDD